MDTHDVIARFESERQALALMDHPAIAKIFDAGATPLGRPYFVMEYVNGVPITAYCDKHGLTVKDRLELFIRVLRGRAACPPEGHYPSRFEASKILVGEVDSKPVPPIIDFGVAKATAQRLTDRSLYTQIGATIGTPEYMSPEQAGAIIYSQ